MYALSLWCVLAVASARIVFPENSDVGYIVSDDIPIDRLEGGRNLDDEEWRPSPVQDDGSDPNAVVGIKRALGNNAQLHRLEFLQNPKKAEQTLTNTSFTSWDGVWYRRSGIGIPEAVRDAAYIDKVESVSKDMEDEDHGVQMGVSTVKCDNAQVNLTVDWDNSSVNYTCYTPKNRLEIRNDLEPINKCDTIPEGYFPQHYCMSTRIKYNSTLPTYGPHRPLWPLWGEYQFVPPQRWLHGVEHGAIIMAYHPCTEPYLVKQLRKLVIGCIYKHIITPSNQLSLDRPLALVAWGCSLQMSTIDEAQVKQFIKDKGLKGPEGKYTKLGHYKHSLLVPAVPHNGSNESEPILCPN